jgi:hypothetical protein
MLIVIKRVSCEILRKVTSEQKVFDLVLMSKIMTNKTAEPEEDQYDQHIRSIMYDGLVYIIYMGGGTEPKVISTVLLIM